MYISKKDYEKINENLEMLAQIKKDAILFLWGKTPSEKRESIDKLVKDKINEEGDNFRDTVNFKALCFAQDVIWKLFSDEL